MSKLYAWGLGNEGELGGGFVYENRSSPIQIGAQADWAFVCAGDRRSFGIRGGKLYVTGYSTTTGALGLGAGETSQSSPVQVGSATDWSLVSAGRYFNLGIKTTGKLYTWGVSTYGCLGLGATTSVGSPAQIGAQTDWAFASAGKYFALGLKSTGKLYAWGQNNYGQLGLGDTVNRSSPVQIGTETDWAALGCGDNFWVGIKTTGKLYSCGKNNVGQLGLGDTTNRSSPVQVGALTDWSKIDCGEAFWLAIKTTGQLFSCGSNVAGQLGLNDAVNRSSPVQVGSSAYWGEISAGKTTWTATKTTGQLFSCGGSYFGVLGTGGSAYTVSSPVQVGAHVGWSKVSNDFNHVWALSDYDPSSLSVFDMSQSQSLDSPTMDLFLNPGIDSLSITQSLSSAVLSAQQTLNINNLLTEQSFDFEVLPVNYYLEADSMVISLVSLANMSLSFFGGLKVNNLKQRFRLSEWLRLKKNPTLVMWDQSQKTNLESAFISQFLNSQTNNVAQSCNLGGLALISETPINIANLLGGTSLSNLSVFVDNVLAVDSMVASNATQNVVTFKP